MKSTLAVAFFALLAVSASAAVQDWGYPEEEDVIVLTDSLFDEVVAKFDFIMVEFYAPWCGHCKKLAPEYAKAAKTLKGQEQAVPLAKVDATTETGLAGRFEIQGFPTVKFFIKGKAVEYNGGRTASEIVSWVNKKSGPTSQELSTAEALEAFRKQNKVGVVFYGESSSAQYQAYLGVSAAFDDVAFAHTFEVALREADTAPVNSVVVYKQFDEGRVVYPGDVATGDVAQFIRDNQFPIVIEIDQSTAQKVFGERRDVLILFVKSNTDPIIDQLRATESALRGKILLTYVTFVDFGKRVADYIGVNPSEAPTTRILKQSTGEMIKYKPATAEVTAENLISFYNGVNSGEVQPFYKSEEIPETNDEPVKVTPSSLLQLDRPPSKIPQHFPPIYSLCDGCPLNFETS